jgi:O-antigen/teichoic acid export membrane protein
MTPIFVKNLGNYDYGVWEIMASIVGYMGILDLGIKPAITRFSAQYNADNDMFKLKVMYSSALAFTSSIGVVLCCVLICWGVFYPESISETSNDIEKYSLVLIILGIQLLIVFPGYVPTSFLQGFQLFKVKNNVTLFNSIAGAFVLYLFITPENGLFLLALVNAIGLSTKSIAFFYIVYKEKQGALYPQVKNIKVSELIVLLKFGGKSFIQGLAFKIESVTDVLVIGYFIGPASVPLYSIPANLVNHLRNIGYTLTLALMPQFSELLAKKDKKAILNLYLNASKWVIFVMVPMCIFAVTFGPSFITIWLGNEYGENSQIILLLLVLFTVIPFLDPIQARYLTAINKHGILAKLFPISAFINITISIALVDSYGIYGVAFGSVVPVFIFTPIYLNYSCKHLGISVTEYLKSTIAPLFVPNILLLAAVIYTTYIINIDSYILLISCCIMNACFYLLLIWTFTLTKIEKRKFFDRLIRKSL